MKFHYRLIIPITVLLISALACQTIFNTPEQPNETQSTNTPAPPTATPTLLPPKPVEPGDVNPNEPVFITGDIPYTSPFFVDTLGDPLVLLEDQAGFVFRDREFTFALEGQAIGPVEILAEGSLSYSLALPSIPQGTFVDVDNNGEDDLGIQVFAVAYWSNTWGGPFLEERDASGWSTGHVSTIIDPEQDDEIVGGILIVWAPDDRQSFPTGFGKDERLFTEDDPTSPVPAGYNLVDLNDEPFRVYKEARPEITLNEGASAVNDFSELSYSEAFEALFQKTSREYPFTVEKGIDWDALHNEFTPRIAAARTDQDFYKAMHDFSLSIPDGHVGISIDPQVFFETSGGGFGMRLAELSDGRVIVIEILPGESAAEAGIEVGAEIIQWEGKPIAEAIKDTTSYFGPYSTQHTERLGKIVFLTRLPPGEDVVLTFQNPGDLSPREITITADPELDSLFNAIPSFNFDELALPVDAEIMDENGLGYIQITTFSDDYNLMAQLWHRFIETLIEVETPGLIIDVRTNGGGSGGLAADFVGYFFEDEIEISHRSYYNDNTGDFEFVDLISKIRPGPLYYEGKIALLVGPDCVSACEGFAHMMSQNDRAILIGHFPTAGAFGEVGRGQYDLPGDYSMQFPTGRPETLDGDLLIEGTGVIPDILVPITEASALGLEDTVLDAAIGELR